MDGGGGGLDSLSGGGSCFAKMTSGAAVDFCSTRLGL